jgi:hypothetical protein
MMDMMSVNMALSHDSTVDRDGGVRRCAHVCGWMVGREKDKISTNNACIDVMTLAATATTAVGGRAACVKRVGVLVW